MIYLKHLHAMARYNQWMNEKLAAVCAQIPDADRRRDLGAFFKSIHATLNHLLLADRIWLGRFKAEPFPAAALAQELYFDYEELIQGRARTDRDILAYVAGLDQETLAQPMTYVAMSARQEKTLPHWLALSHFFNHQTHHRGQITALLSRLGYDFGVTDLPFMPSLAD